MRIEASTLISAQAARMASPLQPAAKTATAKPIFEPLKFSQAREDVSATKPAATRAAYQLPGSQLDIKI